MAEGTSWTVTGQREDMQDPGNGTYTRGVVIEFTTGRGNHGTVFVPDRDYNPTAATRAIAARAAAMDAVSDLSGT